MKKFFTSIAILLLSLTSLYAQDKKGPSAEELAKANNPLADLVAFNIQHYARPALNETTGGAANSTWMRFAMPTGRVLWRLSAPLETRFINNETTNFSKSGLGDIDLTAFYLGVMKPKITFGFGPSASFNTASDAALGSGKNTLGAAAVVYAIASPQFQYGGLVTWRTDIGGDPSRDGVNLLAVQPFYFWQLGKGLYFRGAPIMTFDMETGNYAVPIGLGMGKVVKLDKTVLNFFVEPQPSVIVHGAGQPTFQVYGGLNMQF
ncbi:hypothetical protein [Flammeovirga aprica]|uniref:Transporter n=1 Tax=Flammeovirga aprica JL-4 TaxID=694437 RepID=A0A7X9NYS3_9BACT|nr:hypothetical protein [Flammeovirga aprica]NME66396.1 hypothetical protein [Flammeovirga aprica JL-4]